MPRKINLPQRPSCPYCHHPKVYVNSRYFRRAPDGSLTQVFSFICPKCKRTFSFPKASRSPNPNNRLFHEIMKTYRIEGFEMKCRLIL